MDKTLPRAEFGRGQAGLVHLKLGLMRLGQAGFIQDFAVAKGLGRDKLGLIGPRLEDFTKLTRRDLRFASSSFGLVLGSFGFALMGENLRFLS